MEDGQLRVRLNVSIIHGLPPPHIYYTLHNLMLQTLRNRGSFKEFDGIFNRLLVVVGRLPHTVLVLESL